MNSQERMSKFLSLRTCDELMDFMDEYIKFGWIDVNRERHEENLNDLRELYRINSVRDTLESGLGTCIEQANIIKSFMDSMNVENKMYVSRIVEDENVTEGKIMMHVFILFKYKDTWYHFEHSNPYLKGIKKYESLESAVNGVSSYLKRYEERKTTEIQEIPVGYTYKDFNLYLNKIDNGNVL